MTSLDNMIWQAKLVSKNNWIMAVNLLEQAIRSYPNEKSPLFELADIYNKNSKTRESIDAYDRILSIDVKDDYAHFKIANCYLELAEPKLAVHHFQQIKEAFPEAEYNLAIAYQRLGQDQDCVNTLKKLVERQPDSELPYLFLTEQLIKLSQYDEALKVLENLNGKLGETDQLLYYKGVCYTYMNMNLKAYVCFQKSEKGNLRSSNFYHAFGIVCEKIGKIDEAVELLEKSISLSPQNPGIYFDLIKVLIKNNLFDRVDEVIEEIKKIHPASAVLAQNLVKSFQKGK